MLVTLCDSVPVPEKSFIFCRVGDPWIRGPVAWIDFPVYFVVLVTLCDSVPVPEKSFIFCRVGDYTCVEPRFGTDFPV